MSKLFLSHSPQRWCILLLSVIHSISPATAHEKWFHDPKPYPSRPDLFLQTLPLALTAAVLVSTGIAWVLWRRWNRDLLPGPAFFGAQPHTRALLYGIIPAILGVHVAVPLLVNGVQGRLFSPNNELEGAWTYMVGLAQTGIALSFFYGGFTRVAAVALAGLWLLGIPLMGLEPMLDNAHYLGFAAFFFMAGRGPISIDRLLFPNWEPPAHLMRHAVAALRISLGVALVAVAFSEKLFNLPLALGFLDKYPINFTHALGLPLSNEIFVWCAGAVELLVGLWLLFNIFPREIIIVAMLPFNLTLTYFNWTELIGHLPFYGILAVLLVWTREAENDVLWLRGMRGEILPIDKTT
jgi:hypothetical protein